jgi:hypothetical protein
MNDLEERLTTHLTQAADAADLTPPDVDDVLTAVAQHRRRRRIRTGLLAAAVALVAAGTVSVLTTDNPSRTDISDSPSTTAAPTTEAPTTTPPTTTTTTLPPATVAPPPAEEVTETAEGLIVRGDGVGTADLGDSYEQVVAALSPRFGDPGWDSGVQSTASAGQWPDGCERLTVYRFVDWDGASAQFVGTSAADLQLVSVTVRRVGEASVSPPVVTEAGLNLDDPLDVWEATYGDRFATHPVSPESDTWLSVELRTDSGTLTGFASAAPVGNEITELSARGECTGSVGDI